MSSPIHDGFVRINNLLSDYFTFPEFKVNESKDIIKLQKLSRKTQYPGGVGKYINKQNALGVLKIASYVFFAVPAAAGLGIAYALRRHDYTPIKQTEDKETEVFKGTLFSGSDDDDDFYRKGNTINAWGGNVDSEEEDSKSAEKVTSPETRSSELKKLDGRNKKSGYAYSREAKDKDTKFKKSFPEYDGLFWDDESAEKNLTSQRPTIVWLSRSEGKFKISTLDKDDKPTTLTYDDEKSWITNAQAFKVLDR